MSEEELLKKYNRLYLEIILRYWEVIEKGETLHVAELPKLVTPQEEPVLALAKNLIGAFPSYNPEKDFYDALRQAHKYIKDSITTVNPPIEFWLTPSQVISLEAGDVFDKAVLLCSLIIAMGNVSAKVLTVIRDGNKSYAVYCDFAGKVISADVEGDLTNFQNKEELLAKMGVKESEEMTAYEFNDKMYNNLV